GRQGAVDGQCLYRAALAVAEIRVRLSARIRERGRGAQGDRSVVEILRRAASPFGARRAHARRGLRGCCAIVHKSAAAKMQKTTTTETGGLTAIEPSLIPPPGSLTTGRHLNLHVGVRRLHSVDYDQAAI